MFLLQIYRTLVFSAYGSLHFTKSSFLEHAKRFKEEDMKVDMVGKNCIVTGSNTGIGFASAEALASRGANVHLVCRNKGKGEQAISILKERTGNPNIELEVCDLSSLQDVKDLVKRFNVKEQPLHVLVNNAGVLENSYGRTQDGLELNFSVNVAAPYMLTELLLPRLEQAAPDSRVITVSSGGMYGSPLVEDLQYQNGKFDGVIQYSRNKRIQVAMTERWAHIYGNKGIGFYSMHPGWVDTEGVDRSLPILKKMFDGKLRSWEQGADTIVWLALQPNNKLKQGEFYFDRNESPKHLLGFGTRYEPKQVDLIAKMVHTLCGLP